MEDFEFKSKSNSVDADDNFFFDAGDDFPFYDSTPNFETESFLIDPIEIKDTPDCNPLPLGLRRRQNSSVSDFSSVGYSVDASAVPRYRKHKLSKNLKETNDKIFEKSGSVRASVIEDDTNESSVITTANNDNVRNDDELNSGDSIDNSYSFLLYLAGLIVKVIGFQMNLLVSFVTFPVWFIYSSYMFMMDPFYIVRYCKDYVYGILFGIVSGFWESVTSFIWGWFKDNNSTWKVVLRCFWGLLWSAYVCFILAGLFVSAFVVSGVLMSYVVEEPLQMKEDLNFDYTQDSPAAFVPIISCPDVSCADCIGKSEFENFGVARVIPPNHKLQAIVSLTLPESDYNRNLGIFQVRVDFLSATGKPLGSLRQATMLQFKSLPIQLLLTFFKMAPLATGYISETQTLNIKFRGFTERNVPTSCVRVVVEQRAEFHAGAGIPEIYEASVNVESELPLLKKILWAWKRTIFVWTSIMMFTMELLFTLVCCTSILVPSVRLRGGFTGNNDNVSQSNHQAQG